MSYPPQSEADLYRMVDSYLTLRYPNILKRYDSGGMFTPSHLQRNLYGRLNKPGWPDLFIAHPVELAPGVILYGLFIEIKREGVRLKKANGEWATEHIERQALTLEALNQAGYSASFAVGYTQVVDKVDEYMRWPIASPRARPVDKSVKAEDDTELF